MEKLNRDMELTLIKNSQNGSRKAFNMLYEQYQRLVHKVAAKFDPAKGLDREDYLSYGEVGLMNAIQGYDTTKDNTFYSYAYKCIWNEIANCIGQYGKKAVTLSIDEDIKVSVDEDGYETGITFSSIDTDYLDRESDMQRLEYAIRVLTPKEKEVFVLNHGLFGNEKMDLKDIAAMRGVSHEAVRKMGKHAEEKVAEEMNKIPELY